MWDTTAADVAATLGGNGWLSIASLAVLIMFFAVSLAYMVAYAFNLMDLKRWAKTELQQAFASAVLVALLFGVIVAEDDVTNTSYGVNYIQGLIESSAAGIVAPGVSGGKVSPFDVAYAQLRAMLDCTKSRYVEIHRDVMLIEMFFSMQFKLTEPKSFTLDLGSIIKMAMVPMWQSMNQAYYEANNLVWLGLATYFQLNFLAWVETSAFTVFLPLGLVLRIFPFTRGAGAVLMAIAIGLYLVYPMMMVIMYTMVDTPKGCVKPEMKVEAEKICASDPGAFVQLQKRAVAAQAKMGAGGSNTAKMIVYAYFFPLVNIIVTIAFIRTIAGFLGADIAEIGRGLFKLI